MDDRARAELISKRVIREILASAVAGAEDILASRSDPAEATIKVSARITDIFQAEFAAVRAERDAEWSAAAKRLSGATVPFADGCAFQIGHTSCPMGTATVEELAELRNADNALNALIEEVK